MANFFRRFYPDPPESFPALFVVVCLQSFTLSILLLHSLSCQPLFFGNFNISQDVTPTLHDLLSIVPEDHQLQVAHLALNRTAMCIDSFTLPHLRSLISLDLRNLPAPSDLIDDVNFTSERLKWACSTADICTVLKRYLSQTFRRQ